MSDLFAFGAARGATRLLFLGAPPVAASVARSTPRLEGEVGKLAEQEKELTKLRAQVDGYTKREREGQPQHVRLHRAERDRVAVGVLWLRGGGLGVRGLGVRVLAHNA